jgi:hypothetical protein
LIHYDEQAEALDFVFRALRRHAPEVIDALRDWDEASIVDWAVAYNLSSQRQIE